MENEVKENYKLPKVIHNEIYKKIEKEVFCISKPEKQPIAIIVGGQSGSGKGSVISYSKNQVEKTGKDIVIITTDEYKPYHPQAIEIAKKYPTQYVEIIEQDSGAWTGKILKKAIDKKYNFIFECTLKNDRIMERIKELNQQGFKVIVRALAVSELESLLSIHERYSIQIENIGFGRLISVEHHNSAYNGIPQVIDKIEKSKLCTIEIFKKGEKINKPIKIYSSDVKDRRYPTARIALEEVRKSEKYKTHLTAKQRIEKLKKSYKERNATEQEFYELQKLEEILNKDLEQTI